MNKGQIEIHVGETPESVGRRAVEAWHDMERGEDIDERHVGFETWEAMVLVLTSERIALLRHLHRHPTNNIQALAQSLDRDDGSVAGDIVALESAGLLDRDDDGMRADYDGFDLRMRVTL